MFIQTKDALINLCNVSNINIIRGSKRIAFNMNYGIDISRGNKSKTVSDYVYWDADDKDDFDIMVNILYANNYFEHNFLRGSLYNGAVSYININEVSSIKFSKNNNRIIFNLSHSITFKDNHNKEKLTSGFVFVEFNTKSEYNQYCTNLTHLVLRRKHN